MLSLVVRRLLRNRKAELDQGERRGDAVYY
jgi:hypothetical protein